MITPFFSIVLLVAGFSAAWIVVTAAADTLVSLFACWMKSMFLEYGC